MPAGAWKAWRLLLHGRRISFLSAHELVETAPERRDGLIFLRHPKNLLELAVENVARGEQLLEALR